VLDGVPREDEEDEGSAIGTMMVVVCGMNGLLLYTDPPFWSCATFELVQPVTTDSMPHFPNSNGTKKKSPVSNDFICELFIRYNIFFQMQILSSDSFDAPHALLDPL